MFNNIIVILIVIKKKTMYVPEIFEITDPKIIEQFIKENGFGTLITASSPFPVGTHIPMLLETNAIGDKVLTGHISKENPQGLDFEKSPQVLAIFLSSIHQYISSSWYNHPNAPTWNYISVHVSGNLKIIEGDTLWKAVSQLTDKYEQQSKCPVSLETLPKSVQRQMNGIIGFEISIHKIEAAFKLSQNRSQEDFANILNELRLSKDLMASLMADCMERNRENL
jgi:transcriptional regulator